MSGSRRRKPALIGTQRTRDDLGRWGLLNDTGTTVAKHSIIRLSSTKDGGAYHKFVKAIADGTQTQSQLLVLWADSIPGDDLSTASERFLLTGVNTSAATLGDLVYLSATTAGAWTLTPTLEPIGRVTKVHASEGLIWIDPNWALTTAVSSNAQKSRPDWDADWESRIFGTDGGDGDGSVYVNNSTGSDAYGDGTPDNPYATIDAAILDIPHNRDLTGLRNVTISVANTGTAYDLSTHLEAVSQITILCDLPASPDVSTTVNTVVSTTSQTGMELRTNVAYTSDDVYRGWLIKYASNKLGWINASYAGSGLHQIFATQAVNGSAYDTVLVSDALSLYDPTSLVEIRVTNTGGNGLNLDQSDNFKIRYANITTQATNGKVVAYQSRVTFQDCYFGSTVGRLFSNNGSMLLTNCYIATDGEAGFGMVGASGSGVLQIRGGTTFDGGLSDTDDVPIVVSGSRLVFSGPVMFRGCDAISLQNGAEIDYADGYNAEVSTYWWEMTGTEPHVRVTDYDGGTPVRGVIPDIHGVARNVGTIIVYANAPCQLWVGRGTSILVTGKTGGYSFTLTDGADYSSYNAYDGSFIRMDRARTFTAQGVNWGPHKETLSGASPNATIDWSRGPSQVYDCTGVTASNTVTWTFPDNGELGDWSTLEIVQGTTLTHSWNGAYVWAGGTPPTLSTTSGQRDILRFYYTGTDWVGEVVALNVS